MEFKRYRYKVGEEVDFIGSLKEEGLVGKVVGRKKILFGSKKLGHFLENIYLVCVEGEGYFDGKKERFVMDKVMFTESCLERKAATSQEGVAATKSGGIRQ